MHPNQFCKCKSSSQTFKAATSTNNLAKGSKPPLSLTITLALDRARGRNRSALRADVTDLYSFQEGATGYDPSPV